MNYLLGLWGTLNKRVRTVYFGNANVVIEEFNSNHFDFIDFSSALTLSPYNNNMNVKF